MFPVYSTGFMSLKFYRETASNMNIFSNTGQLAMSSLVFFRVLTLETEVILLLPLEMKYAVKNS